jgi:iron complex outermembrane receptor protein
MKAVFGITCGLLLLIPSQLLPQEKETEKADTLEYGMEEISIIGARTKERIIDIPYAVFSVDKKELSYGKKISARDVLVDVPGLFLQNMYGNHDVRIAIRGYGTRSSTGVRGIRILYDGIPVSDPDGETVMDVIDFTSLGAVEVVKGNLSSLYANAPGGVVDFRTDLYYPENFITSMNQLGKFGFRQNGFKFGMKDDNQRVFVSYYYRNIAGYRQHSAEYQNFVNTIYEGYLGTRSSITVLGNYVNGLIQTPGSLTQEEYDADPFAAAPLSLSQNTRKVNKKGRIAFKYTTGFGGPDENELQIMGYGGQKEFEKVDNEYYTLSSRYSVGALLSYTNRTTLFDRRNVFTCGLEYANESGPLNQFENIGGNRGISVLTEYNQGVINAGFYFLEHLNLIEQKFDLFISSRYDFSNFNSDIYIPYGYLDSTRVFKGFTPKIGLNYKILQTVALYTSYGLGYDYPALYEMQNFIFSSNPSYTLNPDIEYQKSNNFEFGIKGNLMNEESVFMKKVFFDVTFFYYKITDEIVPFTINQTSYYRNAAKTNRVGVECGVKTEPFDHFDMIINYTYTNFKYDEFEALNYTPQGTFTADYSGNKEPSIPSSILNFILEYKLLLSESMTGLLLWDCDYISDMYVDDANSAISPGYFFGNIMVGLTYNTEDFGAVFFVGSNNIFDKTYVGFININDYYGRYYNAGEPRNITGGLNLSYKF